MKEYFAHDTAEVSDKATIGMGTKIWNNAQIREGANIGKNCIIGKNTYIDKNVKIGNNVKIQNNVSVYDGVEIEDNVFIGPHVTFTNDKTPRAFNKGWKITKTKVQEGASIGAGSRILCGITIKKYAMIGIGSIVTRTIGEYELAYGNPAKGKGYVCKCGEKAMIMNIEDSLELKCIRCEKTFVAVMEI